MNTESPYVWQALTGRWHWAQRSATTLDERGEGYDTKRKAFNAGKQRLAELQTANAGQNREEYKHDVCPECGTASVPAEGVPDQTLRGCPKCQHDWFEDLDSELPDIRDYIPPDVYLMRVKNLQEHADKLAEELRGILKFPQLTPERIIKAKQALANWEKVRHGG